MKDPAAEVFERFLATFTFHTPCLMEDGSGPFLRVLHASRTAGSSVCINVSLAPFGDPGRIPRATLPMEVFEGVRLRYHNQRGAPLPPEEHVFRDFSDRYAGSSIGTIEGGDGTTVMLCGLSLSGPATASILEEYGCPAGECALLIKWVEDDSAKGEAPNIVFPTRYKGLKVYYAQGMLPKPLRRQ